MTHIHPMSMKAVPNLTQLQAGYPGVRTLLFDMDGTLFDTEKYHTLALQSIGHDHKIIPPLGPKEVHQMLMGKADPLVYELVKEWPNFPKHWDVHTFVNEKNRHLLRILSQVDGSTYISPAIVKLLDDAKNERLQIGLVTSSEKVITKELLKLSKIGHFFSYILTRDDTLIVKPDPWPYKTAMKHFSAQVESTVIFEDSNVGIEAATGSGAHVIKAEWY